MPTTDIAAWDDVGVRIVQVNGEFDVRAASLFRDRRAFGDEAELVVIDLRRATFIDSSALGDLIALQRETGLRGVHLAILRPEGPADRIFQLTGLDNHLPLYDERVPVLAHFNYG